MSFQKKLLFCLLILISLVGCSSPSNDRVLPTLVPTLDISARPTLPPVGEGELRPYPQIEYQNQLVGVSFSHPENWDVAQIGDDQIRLVPNPATVNAFASFISPSILIETLSVENGQLDQAADLGNAESILDGLVSQLQVPYEVVEGATAVSTTHHNGATLQLEQTPPPLISEDVNSEELEPGKVTNEVTILLNGDQVVSVIQSAATEDFESVRSIFEDVTK